MTTRQTHPTSNCQEHITAMLDTLLVPYYRYGAASSQVCIAAVQKGLKHERRESNQFFSSAAGTGPSSPAGPITCQQTARQHVHVLIEPSRLSVGRPRLTLRRWTEGATYIRHGDHHVNGDAVTTHHTHPNWSSRAGMYVCCTVTTNTAFNKKTIHWSVCSSGSFQSTVSLKF